MPLRPLQWLPIVPLLLVLPGAPPAAAGGILIFDDGFDTGDSCAWTLGPSSCLGAGFQIDTPEVLISPGEEITYCYYFETPNAEPIGVHRWALSLGSVTHDVTLFATYGAAWVPAVRQAAGTLSAVDCGFVDSAVTNTTALWMYAAHSSFEQLLLPADDGAGTPLAVELAAGQPLFLQMHFKNPTGVQIANTVTLEAEAFEVGTVYTKTASYLAFNLSINVPATTSGSTASGTCATPPGAKFWMLTTETHHFATEATIRDGVAPLVVTSDWQNPALTTFSGPSFYTFSPAGLTYECTYDNDTGSTVNTGNDPVLDENCAGIGYFFPATRPLLCLDSTGPL